MAIGLADPGGALAQPGGLTDTWHTAPETIPEDVEALWAAPHALLTSNGFERNRNPFFWTLAAGESTSYTFPLPGGVTMAIVGLCDEGCGDLDLTLVNGSGVLDRDIEPDAQPIVEVTPDETGLYAVQVDMVACATEVCAYSVGFYEVPNESGTAGKPDPSGTDPRVVTRQGELTTDDSALESGEFFDRYEVDLEVDQRLIVDLRSSEFDTYLAVQPPKGTALQNDDHEGATDHSRIELVATTPGRYVILATSFEPGVTGAYTLELRVEEAN